VVTSSTPSRLAPALPGAVARARERVESDVQDLGPGEVLDGETREAPSVMPMGTSLADMARPELIEPRMSLDFIVSLSHNLWMFRVSQQAIVDETWRKPVPWVPNFTVKCTACDLEFDELLEACPECGGETRRPDAAEYKWLLDMSGRVNDRRQTIYQVFRAAQLDAEMTDEGWVVLEHVYTWQGTDLVGVRWAAAYHADTRLMRIIVDDQGRFGVSEEWGKLCLDHRREDHGDEDMRCRVCGKALFPVAYVCLHTSGAKERARKYAEWEVVPYQIQHPSLKGGVSPVYTMWRLGYTGVKMEEWQRRTYSHQQPARGAELYKGLTRKQLDENIARNRIERTKHPNEHPKYAMDKDADMKFVSFMPTPEQMQSLEHYEEIRKAIGSIYGVTNIMMGDQSTGVGYANQGMQIHVSNRAVQKRKMVHNTAVFPQFYLFAGIQDHHLEFPPSDEEDQMAALQREQLEFTVDAQAASLGLEVWVDEQGKHHRRGRAKPPGEIVKPPEPPGPGDVEDVELDERLLLDGETRVKSDLQRHMEALLLGLRTWADEHKRLPPPEFEQGLQRELDRLLEQFGVTIQEDAWKQFDRELSKVEREVGQLSIVDRNLAAGEFIRRMMSDTTVSPVPVLQNLRHKLHGGIMEVLYTAYTEEILDHDLLARKLGAVVMGEEYQLRRLARNLTSYISQNTRAEAWEQMELQRGEKFLYEWSVKLDARTSDTCKGIDRDQRSSWSAQGYRGLPLEALKKINQAHSTTGSPLWPHHHCRSTLVRVVRKEAY